MGQTIVRRDGKVFDDVDEAEAKHLLSTSSFVPYGSPAHMGIMGVKAPDAPSAAPSVDMKGAAANTGTPFPVDLAVGHAVTRTMDMGEGIRNLLMHPVNTGRAIHEAGPVELLKNLNPIDVKGYEEGGLPAAVSGTATNLATGYGLGKLMGLAGKTGRLGRAGMAISKAPIVAEEAAPILRRAAQIPKELGLSNLDIADALEGARAAAGPGRASMKPAELVNDLRMRAARKTTSEAQRMTFNKLADAMEQRTAEVGNTGGMLGHIGILNPKINIMRKAAGLVVPTAEQRFERGVAAAQRIVRGRPASATADLLRSVPAGKAVRMGIGVNAAQTTYGLRDDEFDIRKRMLLGGEGHKNIGD